MREIEMAVTADDGVAISGTLAVPDGDGPHPAMVLTWPMGLDREADRGGNRLGLGRPMAEALAAKGVISYRFDPRGTGRTPGGGRTVPLARYRQDAATVLRAVADLPGVSTVGAIGYSEGAQQAAWLAAHAGAASAVLLGCTAQTGEEVYLWGAARWGKDDLPRSIRLALRLFGRTPEDQARRLFARVKSGAPRIYGVPVSRAFREWLVHDPKKDLAAIHVPVLAIIGDKDLHVDVDDLDVIDDLVPGPVETRRFPDLTHLLRRDPGPASRSTYREQYARPVDPELLEEVAAFVSSAGRAGGAGDAPRCP
ncbi:alpha/beta fold hydrolase [Nonomuraea sp. NPDC004354]